MSNMQEIWSTLSRVDLSMYIEKKGGLSFVSWANAWQVVKTHYPQTTYQKLPSETFDDGTVMVSTSVSIDDHTLSMWLPVMDNRNNSIAHPTSRQISDSLMRCLVKNLAMFGLGVYLYQGEDLPRKEQKPVDMEAIKAAAMSVLSYIHGEYTEEEKFSSIKEIFSEMSDEEKSAIWLAKTKGGFFTQDEKAFIRQAASS